MLVASRTLSNQLVLCRPLLLVPSIFPNIRVFSRESSLLIRWLKYCSLSFRICLPRMKRMEVYPYFVRKKSAVLYDIVLVAQGLDFSALNWINQLDCPGDANIYIHRVGRTAKYKEGGETLLALLSSEEKGMMQQLSQKKFPINNIKINPEKLVDIQKKMQSFLAQDQELKERVQRYFVSYLLQEEDKFDKEEDLKEIKEKHREKQLKEKAGRREVRKKRGRGMCFLSRSQ
uniref:ATP-dependent RNA helicase n=1 Tax=Podarcis muralis TaxID=64176 RepID=A0A670K543_PODMU